MAILIGAKEERAKWKMLKRRDDRAHKEKTKIYSKKLQKITADISIANLRSLLVYAEYNIKTKKLTFEAKTEKCERSIDFFGEKNSFTIRSKDSIYMQLQDDRSVISNLNFYGTIHTNDFLFLQKRQWILLHINTFDKKENSWTPSDISTCGNSPDTFLGGPCKFGSTEAYTKIVNLPKHSTLKIKLRVHFFDMWNDDSLFLQVDNKTVWTVPYDLLYGGINVCGMATPDKLSVRKDKIKRKKEYPLKIHLFVVMTLKHLKFVFFNTNWTDEINILMGSTLKKTTDACATSWGVDDLVIYYQ
ncbi:conserved Plasmodium protein, unknown function [Plasmodium ovale curtisi]|uniref:Uncharacterized protein n=1 Tax=Plasmodium ovale curtisi TaxID=864141 RepID=A0A1A8WI46_PLAOA|nr:conserved Plasmodium protein, unknown function [Plasmodium ovale curtisi]